MLEVISPKAMLTSHILESMPLECPLCRASSERPAQRLLQRSATHNWRCAEGHHFDQAKQGYLNLLPAQFKRSKDPGDSKAMVQSRRRFLQSGHYQPIADQLAELITEHKSNAAKILDAGCGEGYYLRQLQEHVSERCLLLGNDVSKWAVQAAAPWHKSGHYVVASNARLPYPDASLDVIICAFGFVSDAEFRRVLAPKGILITIDPLSPHLMALKQLLYSKIQQKDAADPVLAGFCQQQSYELMFNFQLNNQSLQDLIAMTPHAHRAPAEGKARARQANVINLEAAVLFRVWQAEERLS